MDGLEEGEVVLVVGGVGWGDVGEVWGGGIFLVEVDVVEVFVDDELWVVRGKR